MSRFRILGSVEVVTADGALSLGGRRQVALLAYLLVRRNRRVSLDELIDAVWPADSPHGAAKRAQVAVGRLRTALAPLGVESPVETVRGGYVLRVDRSDVDADVFSARVELGSGELAAGRPERAAETLRGALSLWRGPALADVAAEVFARAEIGALEELRVTAVETRIEADLRLGRHRELLGELESLAATHPERESLVGALMVALYRSGRQTEALDVFHRTRERLSGDLGLEPGPALRALQARILAHDATLHPPSRREHARAPIAPSAPEPAAVHGGAAVGTARRPVPTPLFGRDQDLARIVDLLRDPEIRLVTIIGAGGVGKTSVASWVAARMAGELADGALFVDLASVRAAGDVPVAILEAVGAPGATNVDPPTRLRAALETRQQIVVLDNFEQVIAAAPLVGELVDASPGLLLVVTSRVALGLRSEHRYPLAPLGLPADAVDLASVGASSAGALFEARARARDPSFALSRDNAAAVGAICARVGGLPLAIELTAARVTALSPGEIAQRLERGALDFEGDLADTPQRQRSLRRTMEWSVELLGPAERDTFDSFAVFAGGAASDVAETVLGTRLDVLERLLAHSMLTRRQTPNGSRLVMLEPVREYAAERLAARVDRDTVQCRHAEHFLALAEHARRELDGPDWVGWRDRLEADVENLRAALKWATTRPQPDLALALASALRAFWDLQWRAPEGYRWLTAALEAAEGADLRLRARALVERSRVEWDELPADRLTADARAGLEVFRDLGDSGGTADALLSLAIHEALQHRFEAARRLCHDAAALWDSIGQPPAPSAVTLAVSPSGGFDDARRQARRAITELESRGAVRYVGAILVNTAIAAIEAREYGLALSLVEEALPTARAANDLPRVAAILGNEAFAALGVGDDVRAERALVEELHICRRLGSLELVPEVLLGLSCVAAGRGQTERAGFLAGAADAAFRRRPLHPGVDLLLAWIERDRLAPARATAPDTWDKAADRGRSLNDGEALDAALSGLGGAA